MPNSSSDKDPLYNSYLFNRCTTTTTDNSSIGRKPYRPSTHLSPTDLDLEGSKGIYQHFHVPWNQHNRFLASVTEGDKGNYRNLERRPPPPWDETGDHVFRASSTGSRPASAPPQRVRPQDVDPNDTTFLSENMATATGAPCYTVRTNVVADLLEGRPVLDVSCDEASELIAQMRAALAQAQGKGRGGGGASSMHPGSATRRSVSPTAFLLAESKRLSHGNPVARVETYKVPPSASGYGEGGKRPFHQDYRHYKYYGFAGRGAKTSWAHNPKYSIIFPDYGEAVEQATSPGPHDGAAEDPAGPAPPPLQEGGVMRKLTPVERNLFSKFRDHDYPEELVGQGVQGDASARTTATRASHSISLPAGQAVRPSAGGADADFTGTTHVEIVEPFDRTVNLLTKEVIPNGRVDGHRDRARVKTYRQLHSEYYLDLNASPNQGNQSPYYQRYLHYKYNGFAGKGATSSWARNPKLAKLYD